MTTSANAVLPAVLATSMLAAATPAQAERLGGFTGRNVNQQENQGTALEGYYKSFEGSSFGVRLSHRYSDDILVYADFNKFSIEIEDTDLEPDGDNLGAGFYYFRPDLLDGYDAAFKLSYHTGDISESDVAVGGQAGFKFEQNLTEISAEVIISSRTAIASNGLLWYAGVGVHRLSSDGGVKFNNGDTPVLNGTALTGEQSDTELGVSAGLVLPTGFGEVYAAIENIDGNLFGVGARYFLQ